MANKRASSNVTEAANQVMNVDNATQTYMKGTGRGGIPPLVAHACAVDTRRSFFSPPPPCSSEHLDTRLRQLSLWQWELQLHEHSNNCPFEKCYKAVVQNAYFFGQSGTEKALRNGEGQKLLS